MKKYTFATALIHILEKQNVITSKEGKALETGFKNSEKEQFDDFLLEEGLIDETRLLTALSTYYKVPSFDVNGYFFETHILHEFPKDFLLRNAIIPLERDENILIVVASEPNDPELLPRIGNYVSYDIRFLVGIRQDISDAVEEFYDTAVTQVDQDEDLREEHRQQEEEQREEEGLGTTFLPGDIDEIAEEQKIDIDKMLDQEHVRMPIPPTKRK